MPSSTRSLIAVSSGCLVLQLGDTSQQTPRQRIGFTINGDDARSAFAIFSAGSTNYKKKLPLAFSCSDSPHLFTIYWDAKRVS